MAHALKKILYLMAAATLFPPGGSCAAPDKAWLLYQNNSYVPGGGTTIMTLSQRQMKLYSPSLTVFLEGPGHPASIYSEAAKQYFEQPYDDWKKEFVGPEKRSGTRTLEKTQNVSTVAGLKVQEWDRYVVYPGVPKRISRIYWLTKDINVSSGVRDSVRGLAGLTPGEGLPIRIFEYTKSGKKEIVLDTLKVTRAPVTATTFKKPTGYKLAESEMALLMNSSKEDGLVDLYGDASLKRR